MGSVAYTDNKRQRQFLPFSTQIHLVDVLRPAFMNTQQYGQHWLSFKHEKRVVAKGTYTPESLSMTLMNKLKVNVVQKIGK